MDDPRLTPARPDLAAHHLKGRIEAQRYVVGREFEIVASLAPLRAEPSPDAMLLTQALRGERATIYDRNGRGWAWGQLETDGYVGWLAANAVGRPGPAPTHKVTALRTLGFPGPDIKLPPMAALPMGAGVAVAARTAMVCTVRLGTVVVLPALVSALLWPWVYTLLRALRLRLNIN